MKPHVAGLDKNDGLRAENGLFRSGFILNSVGFSSPAPNPAKDERILSILYGYVKMFILKINSEKRIFYGNSEHL